MKQDKTKQEVSTRALTLVALGITMNMVGGFIALQFKLPIYLDAIGTLMVASLLGPKYALLAGIGSNLVGGFTTDPYALYFIPSQIATGFIAGLMYEKGMLQGKKTLLGALIITIPTSFISACIAAYVFGGITSSGSSYIVQILKVLGVPDVISVFSTQVLTDYIDKLTGVFLVAAVLRVCPKSFKARIRHMS